MKFTRERFQNGSLRRVPRKTGPDVWEFRFRDHSKPGLPMRQMTLSTVEYATETAARRALQAELLRINGSDAYTAQRSPIFGTVLDKFIADEHLQEIKARRPGEIVDEGLKYSTTTGYLSVIKLHLRPKWGSVQLTDIKPLTVQEWLAETACSLSEDQAERQGCVPQDGGTRDAMGADARTAESPEPRGDQGWLQPTETEESDHHARAISTDLRQARRAFRIMVVIAMCLGLRVSEILALKWSDFDFEEGTLMITRGTVHARIGRVKTEYSEDEMPLHPAQSPVQN